MANNLFWTDTGIFVTIYIFFEVASHFVWNMVGFLVFISSEFTHQINQGQKRRFWFFTNRQHRMQQLDNNFITFLYPLSRFQGMDIQLREICYDNWKCLLNILKDQFIHRNITEVQATMI
jgi:hypothetical protein